MTTTLEHIDATRVRRPALGTWRLRLKPAHRVCGYVQGAWWPRSKRLAAELPSLLDALTLRFGELDRVCYHQNDWSPTLSGIKLQGYDVILDASLESPNVVTVFGKRFGRLALLVMPPLTNRSDADVMMTKAATVGDVSTPEQLLGISQRGARNGHTNMAQRRQREAHRWSCRGPRL